MIFLYHFTPVWAFYPPSPGVHVHKRTLSVLNPFSVVWRALFVTFSVVPVALIQCYRTWVGKILRHVGRSPIWQCFFKIKTGNVQISFSNDLREVHCPYLTWGSAKHPFQFQRYSSTTNAHKYSFFVRTVPVWNALSPVSVCADSVAVFHSSVDDFYLFYCFSFVASKITNIPSDLRRLSYNHLYKQHTDHFCKQYKLYPPGSICPIYEYVFVFYYHVRPRSTGQTSPKRPPWGQKKMTVVESFK